MIPLIRSSLDNSRNQGRDEDDQRKSYEQLTLQGVSEQHLKALCFTLSKHLQPRVFDGDAIDYFLLRSVSSCQQVIADAIPVLPWKRRVSVCVILWFVVFFDIQDDAYNCKSGCQGIVQLLCFYLRILRVCLKCAVMMIFKTKHVRRLQFVGIRPWSINFGVQSHGLLWCTAVLLSLILGFVLLS